MRKIVIFSFIIAALFSLGLGFNAYSDTSSTGTVDNSVTVSDNTKVTLSGLTSTDPQALSLKYLWTQVSGDPVTMSSNTAPEITFTTPAVAPGETKSLTFSLTVNNAHGGIDTTNYTLLVVHNSPPVVVTQHQIVVPQLTNVLLKGSGSDPEGGPVALTWTQSSGDNVILSSPNQPTTSFLAPAVDAGQTKTLTFTLTGVDNNGLSASDVETVTVIHITPVSVTCPPIQQAKLGDTLTISPQIYNPYNAALTFGWKQGAGDKIVNLPIDKQDLTFTVPNKIHGYELSFTLNVYESNILVGNCDSFIYFSDIGEYAITDTGPQQTKPFTKANAGLDATMPELTTVFLDGTHSLGRNLSYFWVQTAGEPVTLIGANTAQPSFITPNVDNLDIKDLEFKLTITDGFITDSDSVHIKVYNHLYPPTARITIK